jgi:SEC-C motif
VIKPGRNDACPCGSGKKYKRCCIDAESSIVEPSVPIPRFVNRASDLKRATLDFIDDCSRTLGITSNAAGTAGQLPRRIHGEAIREVYQRLPSYFPHGSSHSSLLRDLATRTSRGVYLGPTTPQTVLTHLTRHSLYNEHIVVPNPFCDLSMYRRDFSPILRPEPWRQVTANQTMYMLVLKPWIEADIVTCLPPLKWFDPKADPNLSVKNRGVSVNSLRLAIGRISLHGDATEKAPSRSQQAVAAIIEGGRRSHGAPTA